MAASPASVRWLGAAGVVAPLGFSAAALTQSLMREGHGLRTDPVSALAAGATGWVQDLAFGVTGVLMIGFAFGLQLAVRPSRAGAIGPALIAVHGLGLLGAALFPATDANGAFVEDRVPHVIAGVVAFSSAGLGTLLVSSRLARDDDWRDLAGYVRVVDVTLLVLCIAGGVLVRPADAPFHDWLGSSGSFSRRGIRPSSCWHFGFFG